MDYKQYQALVKDTKSGDKTAARELLKQAVRRDDGAKVQLAVSVLYGDPVLVCHVDIPRNMPSRESRSLMNRARSQVENLIADGNNLWFIPRLVGNPKVEFEYLHIPSSISDNVKARVEARARQEDAEE